jgi:hypothetical protein
MTASQDPFDQQLRDFRDLFDFFDNRYTGLVLGYTGTRVILRHWFFRL